MIRGVTVTIINYESPLIGRDVDSVTGRNQLPCYIFNEYFLSVFYRLCVLYLCTVNSKIVSVFSSVVTRNLFHPA